MRRTLARRAARSGARTGRRATVLVLAAVAPGCARRDTPSPTRDSVPPGAGSANASSPSALAFPVEWSASLQLPSLDRIPARLSHATPDTAELVTYDVRCSARAGSRDTTCAEIDTVVTTTCDEYRRRTQAGYGASSTLRLAQLQDVGVRCSALRLLARARPPARSAVRQFVLNPAAPDSLPPTLGVTVTPGDSTRAYDALRRGRTWRQTEPGLKATIEPNGGQDPRLRVAAASGTTLLSILGRGDFDGDGWDDVLIWVTNSPRGGTLTVDDIVLLTRRNPGTPLRLVPTPREP